MNPTKTVRYRSVNIELFDTPEEWTWKVKREDGSLITEPDNEWTFGGEDESVALENAKEAVNDWYSNK